MGFSELHDYVEKHQANIRGIAAVKDGELVYADSWGGYSLTDTVHVMSVTKSVVALLVGIAIDMGLIGGVGDKVIDYFPEYKVKRGEKTIQQVAIEHLLTMTAPYKYKYEPWSKICVKDDWTVSALDFLGGRSGISGEFKYSTLGIHILCGIIAKKSGMTTVEFANKYLFEKIGVAPKKVYVAETEVEHKEFIVSKSPKGDVWFSDPTGVGAAGFGLCLNVAEMAKIGTLCLNGGMCGGERVVSGEWIKECTKPRVLCIDEFANMSYGYLWWIPYENERVYSALGNSGNVIYVDSDRNIVVSVSAVFKPTVLDRLDFIRERILPLL